MINPQNTHTYLIRSTGTQLHQMAEGIGCNLLLTNQSALPPPDDVGAGVRS